MTPETGWFPDPSGRHRLRYRDHSGWSAWVADDAGTLTDPEGVPTEPLPAEGWYPDPGAFRQRWWDGKQWMNRVVGSGLRIRYSQPDPSWAPPSAELSAERTERSRRVTHVVLVATAIAVGIALGIVAYAALDDAARDYNRAVGGGDSTDRISLAIDMNRWELPATVRPYHGLYDYGSGRLVERYYLPASGVAVTQAAEDLVTALRAQGYRDLEVVQLGERSGSCRASDACRRLWMSADDVNVRIVVTVTR